MGDRRVRIGIDVGGTFTHAVAMDAATLALLGKTRVPTTHDAAEGVAGGVVRALFDLLDDCRLDRSEVMLIAHSTTQATNALLEGDVDPVGIVGMGGGSGAWPARWQTAIKFIPLAPGRFIQTSHVFLRSERADPAAIGAAIDLVCAAGARAIVAAEAFSVDDPTLERRVCEIAGARGLIATATHEVSRLHGLRTRTRTAVINACIISRMLRTAEMTERAVREAGIAAPLMIMRSDGGVMSLDEMRRRPILTMLSGPAAGVAAALLYARVSDGVFLEVGGTSTDISVIKNGRCQIRSAEVGGQKLHVSTLDVRTLGVAGGSLAALKDGRLDRVGPRSAHIAGLPYLSFAGVPRDRLRGAAHVFESETVAAVRTEGRSGGSLTNESSIEACGATHETHDVFVLTPTCASNALGLVPPGDPAAGDRELASAGFEALGRFLTPVLDGPGVARRLLDIAAEQVVEAVNGLLRDYELDRGLVRLVGGGGGASAIVPHVAARMDLPFDLVPDADVISAIGVALALVRETVERTVIAPTEDDMRQIRREAAERVLRMGAAADTIEVFVEVDAKRNLLRATAEGSTEIRRTEARPGALTPEQRAESVQSSLGAGAAVPTLSIAAAGFEVWELMRETPVFWKFGRRRRRAVRLIDMAGTIRWRSNNAEARVTIARNAAADLATLAERHTRYSDAGAAIPRCFAAAAGRIVNLSALVDMKQVLEVLGLELARCGGEEPCILLVEPPG